MAPALMQRQKPREGPLPADAGLHSSKIEGWHKRTVTSAFLHARLQSFFIFLHQCTLLQGLQGFQSSEALEGHRSACTSGSELASLASAMSKLFGFLDRQT